MPSPDAIGKRRIWAIERIGIHFTDFDVSTRFNYHERKMISVVMLERIADWLDDNYQPVGNMPDSAVDLQNLTVDNLKTLASGLGVSVDGTLKADYVEAIASHVNN